ncbi:organic hydroperoxide resistance protein [Granulosicoccus antarcticus]|uniref:Organic hydroperoxide resistance protein OhrA n=1 Tax=Granulosicoccus antarcticus IMCC3135 TaxID=1192854 RepID=A0A2Z2NM70_9GAMM|nr:organic hydroperoxide resistance protein [Granulosicoccus antarcticus]ASJ70878.1 Organic hydroperoxide resistance protein OhrA [Granulosicoccus antarcticus IMCC3135]
MSVDVKYTTQARANGGRDGKAQTLDGAFSVNLTTPKELGGAGGEGNNPEQLFAAGYAACFLGAMKFVAGNEEGYCQVSAETTVTSAVGIGPRSEGGFGLEVSLEVDIPGAEKAEIDKLVKRAHEVCPYSNATRNNIDVKLSVA